MENKLEYLRIILRTRLRYVEKWNSVSATIEKDYGDKEVVNITWFNQGEPNSFERIIYPIDRITNAIQAQERKLLRDMPDCEKEVYKKVLCK